MFDIKECENEMKASIEAFSNDLKNIRTGRVSPDILKNIIIDSYGSKMPITQLSNINNLDNMTLSINIWDGTLTKNIEKNLANLSDLRDETITISIGLCEVLQDDNDDKIYTRADKLMYKSKNNGPNLVVAYAEKLSNPSIQIKTRKSIRL